jgi:hypothetical protein
VKDPPPRSMQTVSTTGNILSNIVDEDDNNKPVYIGR